MPVTGPEVSDAPPPPGSPPSPGRTSPVPPSPGEMARLRELVGAAEKIGEDPVLALQAVIAIATSRLPTLREERSRGFNPVDGRRPFLGYDVEREFYRRRKPDLLTRDEGRYVVLVGEEMLGPFDTSREAMREGYARFGLGPLYIKQVLTEEPVALISRFFG